MKKKIYILTALMLMSASIYALSYSPDVWTTCLSGGTYTNNSEQTPANEGWCAFTGTAWRDNHEVDVTECLPNEVPMASKCSGNGQLRADVNPE